MLCETGRVVAVDADSVWVETVRRTTCGKCSLQSGCGHGLLSRFAAGHRPLVRALPGTIQPADCRVDDEVQISIPESVILRGSLVVYVLPVLCMLAGGAFAASLGPAGSELWPAAGVVCGFAAGLAGVRWHARHHRDDRTLQPTLVGIQRRAGEVITVS